MVLAKIILYLKLWTGATASKTKKSSIQQKGHHLQITVISKWISHVNRRQNNEIRHILSTLLQNEKLRRKLSSLVERAITKIGHENFFRKNCFKGKII